MPLVVLSAAEAVSNRKANRYANWGDRGRANRVEPIAKPAFDVPFRLMEGQSVFTIGSCFARNVERELGELGFKLPVRELFRTPAFSGVELGVINNYGTPSIANELAWALGKEDYVLTDHILEIFPGKFADIHLSPGLRPEPWDVLVERRKAIFEAYRKGTECDVTIMTLGLCELWFDRHTGYYLNVSPRPSMISSEPDRFELRVLAHDEAKAALDRAIALLRDANPAMNIILTVSPVPMMVTQRPIDVMVANTYSKSLLRVVAEEVATSLDFVSYFPSYESFVLSDRRVAFREDLVHTQDRLVALNVKRMISAYVHGRDSLEGEPDPLAEAEALLLVDPQAALDHVADDTSLAAAVLRAQALVALGRQAEAHREIEEHCPAGCNSFAAYDALISAAMATRDVLKLEAAVAQAERWIPFRAAALRKRADEWLAVHSDLAPQPA